MPREERLELIRPPTTSSLAVARIHGERDEADGEVKRGGHRGPESPEVSGNPMNPEKTIGPWNVQKKHFQQLGVQS